MDECVLAELIDYYKIQVEPLDFVAHSSEFTFKVHENLSRQQKKSSFLIKSPRKLLKFKSKVRQVINASLLMKGSSKIRNMEYPQMSQFSRQDYESERIIEHYDE